MMISHVLFQLRQPLPHGIAAHDREQGLPLPFIVSVIRNASSQHSIAYNEHGLCGFNPSATSVLPNIFHPSLVGIPPNRLYVHLTAVLLATLELRRNAGLSACLPLQDKQFWFVNIRHARSKKSTISSLFLWFLLRKRYNFHKPIAMGHGRRVVCVVNL